jgi:hypothetical protein
MIDLILPIGTVINRRICQFPVISSSLANTAGGVSTSYKWSLISLYSRLHFSIFSRVSSSEMNESTFNHSSLKLPLKDSMKGLLRVCPAWRSPRPLYRREPTCVQRQKDKLKLMVNLYQQRCRSARLTDSSERAHNRFPLKDCSPQ